MILGVEVVAVVGAMVVEVIVVVVAAMVVEVIIVVVASKVVGFSLVTANSESVLEFEVGIPSLAPEKLFEEKLSSCMLYLMEIQNYVMFRKMYSHYLEGNKISQNNFHIAGWALYCIRCGYDYHKSIQRR